LPEAFAGFRRELGAFPVPYPTACSPQAWATATPFLFVQAMLGLEARDGRLTLDPCIPDEIGRICVHRLPAFGTHWDVEAIGASGQVGLARGAGAGSVTRGAGPTGGIPRGRAGPFVHWRPADRRFAWTRSAWR